MLHINTATKLAEIMDAAANEYRIRSGGDWVYDSFAECVGREFWLAFGRYEQSQLMQEVYSVLCDMGYTPMESQQSY